MIGNGFDERLLIYHLIQGLMREYPLCCITQYSYERARRIYNTKRPKGWAGRYSVRSAEHLDLPLVGMLKPDPYEMCAKCASEAKK